MSFPDASSFTGMPGKKTHRGRRSRGKGPMLPPGAGTHHTALNAAMAGGDHAAAKSSALNLAKALHMAMAKKAAMGGAPPVPGGEPDADDAGGPGGGTPGGMGGLQMGPPPQGY